MTLQTDVGAYIATRAGGAVSAVAAGAGDNVEVDGAWIDRQGYHSCKLVVAYETVLAAAETLTMSANLQDATSSAGAGAADYGPAFAAAIVETGAGTFQGEVEVDINLIADTVPAGTKRTCNRFIRIQFTPDLSAGATDTAILVSTVVLGGADTLPAVSS